MIDVPVVADVGSLLEAPEGFAPVHRFRASLADVRPWTGRGQIEVRFLIPNLDLAELAPLLAANGRMLEVAVAKAVWSGDED